LCELYTFFSDGGDQGPSIAYWDRIIKWRFYVVAALLIKAKQQHGKNQNKNTGLNGFWCCAYQNKQKIKSSFLKSVFRLKPVSDDFHAKIEKEKVQTI
jgi:hypothetical protein